MEYLIICSAALFASTLTLFSGFGVGALLMPVFALFFPIDVAVAMTAVVHFLNNLFKLALLGRHAHIGTALKFGLPAIFSAFFGAWLLLWLSDLSPLMSYSISGHQFYIMPVKLIISILMAFFAIFELLPDYAGLSIERKYLPLGGILSGFFGGLSGHQGAMRSAFLIRCNLSKEGFIATGVVIACMVDVTRLAVYSTGLLEKVSSNGLLVTAAALSAFAGAFIGRKLLKKVTMHLVQLIVSVMLFGIALGLGTGLI